MAGLHRCAAPDGEECLVERLGHPLLKVGVGCLVLTVSRHIGKLLHEAEVHYGVGGRDKTAVSLACGVLRVYHLRLLGRHTPVAILVACDDVAVHILSRDVVHPLLEVWV